MTSHALKEAKSRILIRVLVAEDNQMTAVRMLEILGAQVDVALNGLEAVEAYKRVPYDLVFMDCQMPEMDGFAASLAIRQAVAARGGIRVPIIAMTANAMQGDREKCLEAGMDDYISKPVKIAELGEMLGRWTQRSRSTAPTKATALPVEQGSTIDASVLDDLRGLEGDSAPNFLTELIDQFIGEAGSRLTALRNAVERADVHALGLAAHSLKGSSGSMGAKTMAALCAELEDRARNGAIDGIAALLGQLEDEFGRVREALYAQVRS